MSDGPRAMSSDPPFTPPLELGRGALQSTPVATEYGLLAHILAYGSNAGYAIPPLLIIDYFVALKSSPFVVLFGASGQGKTELARLFAEALVSPFGDQTATVNLGAAEDGSPFVGLQQRFGWLRFMEFLELAAAPANAGRVFFLCLDDLSPRDVDAYFSLLVQHPGERAYRLALPGFPEQSRPVVPSNVFLTGTLDAERPTYAFQRTTLTRASFVYVRPEWLETNIRTHGARQSIAPVGLQRMLLGGAVRSEEEAMARLTGVLGEALLDELAEPPAALAAIMWQAGLTYDHDWWAAMIRMVANSFDSAGRGLFDPHDAQANARFALVFGLARQMLVRLQGRPEYEQALERTLRQHLAMLPAATLSVMAGGSHSSLYHV